MLGLFWREAHEHCHGFGFRVQGFPEVIKLSQGLQMLVLKLHLREAVLSVTSQKKYFNENPDVLSSLMLLC